MKIIVHSSLAFSLVNFRGALLAALVAEGHEVTATAPDRDARVEEELARIGVGFIQVPMARASLSPLTDLRTLAAYIGLMLRQRPDVVIAYTQKPIIYGGIAARLAGIGSYYVIMSGLGFVFSPAGAARPALRRCVSLLYRQAISRARAVFVFNSDDRAEMLRHRIIGPHHKVVQIPGSGVDTDHFIARPLPEPPRTVLMIARLMRDKGVREFVESARLVKRLFPEARFRILGRVEEDNPTAIGREELARWAEEGVVELLPETRDVRAHLAEAAIFALPSYYREGLPRTILEALATGRPVVTTALPGCRDAIVEGVTGLLVPPCDPVALADAIMRLLRDPERLAAMSLAARRAAEEKYDVRLVNRMLIDAMELSRRDGETDSPAGSITSPVSSAIFASSGAVLATSREGRPDA
ncbi:glycosyl transferase [Altererythrobacter sp. B11]|uniref:glycosyltransferase family 4 protein n=1 Tax=Altererythrobacter sp. B11 TaxID=2060312 RepID=UPI000DC6DA2B|nr:glycosyltransferase family 4 protein [Altererythrobacter sp. B11]BBC72715.1 glycosyl transferase [Altererythrobacter sp. B11]